MMDVVTILNCFLEKLKQLQPYDNGFKQLPPQHDMGVVAGRS
jgi:hypothetical protein